ncbi:cytochrome c [Oligoflexus tunisiensis]|uniref:cytochrome c n=1 Tax=Oligoflexus tunisiensis TaxID=708132 RepID=UPI000AB88C12|nr:cytochrome c [Oligoflexus tunisiensis]
MISGQALVFLSSIMITTLVACSGGSKQNEGKTDTGTTQNAGSETGGDKPGEEPGGEQPKTDDPTKTPAAINIPELMNKMVWKADFGNNGSGKIFSGFGGGKVFKVLVDVYVYGELPEADEAALSDDQLEALYTSTEYETKMKAEAAKVTFTADAAFVSMKVLEEYPAGKVYELTTVQAGTTTAKATYGTTELPLAVTITAYTAAQITAGLNRYNTANGASPACASCHRQATGVDHSPYLMSQFSDAALLSTIETGTNSDDGYKTETPHMMTFANATDKAGIIAYLRSLDPNLLPEQQPAQ